MKVNGTILDLIEVQELYFPMRNQNHTMRLSSLILLTLFMMGCLESVGPNEVERILVNNDAASLALRVTYRSEVVPIIAATLPKGTAEIDTILLTLVAEVAPPVHNGITLQATDIQVSGSHAYVSYNVRGETFLGGIDIFKITNPEQPTLISSAIFTDTDINGITIENDYLYLAAASERSDLDSPAMLERIKLNGRQLTDESEIVDLPSFAATDVDVANRRVYVTSGADGGAITVLNAVNLEIEQSYPVNDARGVDTDKDDVAVIAGTPARLFTFDRNLGTLTNEFELSGATIPFSKSTVEVKARKAFMALGDGGTQVACLATGVLLGIIPQAVVSGLDTNLTVTNMASAYKRTLFTADGEGGLRVATSAENFNKNACQLDSLRMVGSVIFGDGQSVNHVLYRQDMLFVASGLGGLKILLVEVNGDDDDDDDD